MLKSWGTARPFEFIGAPYIKPRPLVEKLKKEKLRGVRFRPLHFQPVFNKWAGELCGGIQVHVTEREFFDPFLTYIAVIRAASQLYPDRFEWRKPPYEYEREKLPIDILCGTSLVREQIEAGQSLKEIRMSWQKDLRGFEKLRRKYLIYRS